MNGPDLTTCRCGARFQSNDGIGGDRCSTCCERVYIPQGAFDELAARVARLERPVADRDAIAWEIGHAAGKRGDAIETNPFRKASQ